MTPEQINAERGKPVWTCVTCKAESGLHCWHGLSVAVCSQSACSEAFGVMCRAQEDAEQAYQDYCREVMG